MADMGTTIALIAAWALPVLFAVTFHEAAHGYVASFLGDDTARQSGRLTLNPIAHIDPFGTVILPLLLLVFVGFAFGYAKPVPVNAARLRHPRRDMIWVALAGPGANILLALAGALLLPVAASVGAPFGPWATQMLHVMVFFNCLIAIFNMLPIPPLDGGRVVAGLLPLSLARPYAQLERYGFLIVVGGLFLLPMLFRAAGIAFDPGRILILLPSQWLYDVFLSMIRLGM